MQRPFDSYHSRASAVRKHGAVARKHAQALLVLAALFACVAAAPQGGEPAARDVPESAPTSKESASASAPASQPAPTENDTRGATTRSAPASRPADPPNPFGPRALPPGQVGTIKLSDGTLLAGYIHLKGKEAFRIFDRDEEKWIEMPLKYVLAIKARILEEHDEREWCWREGGLNDKVYTGRGYVWRKYAHTFEIADGTKINADASGALYIRLLGEKRSRRHIFHMRQKSKMGEGAETLSYMTEIRLENKKRRRRVRRKVVPETEPAEEGALIAPPGGE